ncbi:hypothetical protein RSAG8_04298, partial [Rhizoctonia solani AG-8 WAC10335]
MHTQSTYTYNTTLTPTHTNPSTNTNTRTMKSMRNALAMLNKTTKTTKEVGGQLAPTPKSGWFGRFSIRCGLKSTKKASGSQSASAGTPDKLGRPVSSSLDQLSSTSLT